VSAWLARRALALYPLAYRRRYGAEMEALVEDSGASLAVAADLARGALGAHLRPEPALAAALDERDRLRLTASTVFLCWVVFTAMIFGVAKTTEEAGFRHAAAVHSLIGASHLALELLAVLASAALLLGAVPLVAIALAQVRRRPAVRRAALVAVGCLAAFVVATAALVLLANRQPEIGSGLRAAALTAWIAVGLTCALGCAWAARRGLFAAAMPAAALRLAGACAAVVAVAMAGAVLASALYLVGLLVDTPALAGAGNGPGGALSVGLSLAIFLAAMALAAGVASLSTLRARRTLTG
jgi:hypothetical protein